MLSYRKLAMRVLGRPLYRGGGINKSRSAARSATALLLTGALLTGAAFPAFAKDYYIENGDITVTVNENGEGVTVSANGQKYQDTLDGVVIKGGTGENGSDSASKSSTQEADDDTLPAAGDTGEELTYTAPAPVVNGPDSTEDMLSAQPEETPDASDADAEKAAEEEDTTGDETPEQAPDAESEEADAPAESEAVTPEAKDAPAEAPTASEKDNKDNADDKTITYEEKSPIQVAAEVVTKSVSNVIKIINNVKDKTLKVTLEDVNITATGGKTAVSVSGTGDTTIELDGDNELSGSGWHAALERNAEANGGKLTIQDEDGNGSLTAIGSSQNGAGIGAGGYGKIEITGGDITAVGGSSAAGIGGSGWSGNADITISGGTIRAKGGEQAAGIGGGGLYGSGDITITDDAVIEEAIGGFSGEGAGNSTGGAGIGGGAGGYGTVTISGNAQIKNAVGKDGGAGIGGGVYGLGRVTIEGSTNINATGGLSAAGIGGGYGAENDEDDGIGNQITIRGSKTESPDITAIGGDSKLNYAGVYIPGGAGIGSGAGDGSTEGVSLADADITIDGTVNIVAKGGKDNAAIGANGIEQEFSGLAEGSSITRIDSNGNDISRPGDKPAAPATGSGSSEAPALTAPAAPSSMVPGLTVATASGRSIGYTSTRKDGVLVLRVGRLSASLHTTLGTLSQLREQGIQSITFQTLLRSTTLSLDDLLAMDGSDSEVVLTHHLRSAQLTVGGVVR